MTASWMIGNAYTFYVVMNKQKFNSLPPDIQKELTSKGYTDKEVDSWLAFIKERIEYWKAQEKAKKVPTAYEY